MIGFIIFIVMYLVVGGIIRLAPNVIYELRDQDGPNLEVIIFWPDYLKYL